MRPISKLTLAATSALAFALLAPSSASAQTIIKNPGMHPRGPELEPHLVLRPFDTRDNDLGLGLGFRATFQIGDNLFLKNINNSVGVGVGLDWTSLRGCRGYRDTNGNDYNCDRINVFTVPVVMQWSFYLTQSWSVFGEPGLILTHWGSDPCHDLPGVRCSDDNWMKPTLFVGGRWHFSPNTTLTMRVGWPNWSVGVSWM